MSGIYKQMSTKFKNKQISTVTAKTAVPQGLVLGGGVESHGSTRIPTYGEMEIVPECGCP